MMKHLRTLLSPAWIGLHPAVRLAVLTALFLALTAGANRAGALGEGRLGVSAERRPWAASWALSARDSETRTRIARAAGNPVLPAVHRPFRATLRARIDRDGRVRELAWQGPAPAAAGAEAVRETLLRYRFRPARPSDTREERPALIEVTNFAGQGGLGELMLRTLLLIVLLGLGAGAAWKLTGARWTLGWVAAAWMLVFLSWLFLWRMAPHLAYVRQAPALLELADRHLFMVVTGWGVFLGSALVFRYRGPAFTRWLLARRYTLWGVGILLLILTATPGIGSKLGTTHRLWLKIGPVPIQTIELVKIAMAVFAAGYLRDVSLYPRVVRFSPAEWRKWSVHFGGLLMSFALALLPVVVMGDFGPTLLLAGLLFAGLWACGQRKAALAGAGLLLAAMFAGFHLGFPSVWRERVLDYLAPLEYSEQLSLALWSIRAGGLWGAGLGAGIPYSVPVVESDFLYAAAVEELGWIGGVSVLALLAAVVAGGLRVARSRESLFERYLVMGLSLLLATQAILIVGGVLALLPLSGVTLPFFSQGGTSLWASLASLGCMLGLAGAEQRPEAEAVRERVSASAVQVRWLGGALAGAALCVGLWLSWMTLARPQRYAGSFIDRAFLRRVASAETGGRPLSARDQQRKDALPEGSFVAGPDGDVQIDPYAVSRPDPRSLGTRPRGAILDRDGERLAYTDAEGQRRYHGGDPAVYLHTVGNRSANGAPVGLERDAAPALRGTTDVPPWRWLLPGRPREVTQDLRSTLDADLQQEAYRALGGQFGAVVVVDVKSGDLLAAADAPSIDLTRPRRELPDSALLPRWSRAHYPPGSIFKLFVTGAALENGVATPTTEHRCTGYYHVPGTGQQIGDYARPGARPHAHGELTLADGLAVSCNSWFADLGLKVGPRRLEEFARRGGFGETWNMVPRELSVAEPSVASLPSALAPRGERWPERTNGQLTADQLALSSIGQFNVRVSPLHMALFAAAIGNDGRMPQPRLILDVQKNGKPRWKVPAPSTRQVMTKETARRLQQLMRGVVERGTGRAAQGAAVAVAGKTGTADTRPGEVVAWFVGFAPAEAPRIAVAVAVEGKSGLTGGGTAAPIARRVIEHVLPR